MSLRPAGLAHAMSEQEPALPRAVPRQKPAVATSHCAGFSASFVIGRREAGSYRFAPECFCASPEAHRAQFADGLVVAWRKGNA